MNTLKKVKNHLFDILAYGIIVLAIVYAVFFGTIRVSGVSMEPTYQDGDLIMIRSTSEDVEKGDNVIVDGDALSDRLGFQFNHMIKRVVAEPGDTVEMKDNELYINGEIEVNEHVKTDMINNEDFSLTLEEDEYFVMGDNRNFSSDSRDYGPIKKDEIKGRTMLNLYSQKQ